MHLESLGDLGNSPLLHGALRLEVEDEGFAGVGGGAGGLGHLRGGRADHLQAAAPSPTPWRGSAGDAGELQGGAARQQGCRRRGAGAEEVGGGRRQHGHLFFVLQRLFLLLSSNASLPEAYHLLGSARAGARIGAAPEALSARLYLKRGGPNRVAWVRYVSFVFSSHFFFFFLLLFIYLKYFKNKNNWFKISQYFITQPKNICDI